jgi:hypothetical protein
LNVTQTSLDGGLHPESPPRGTSSTALPLGHIVDTNSFVCTCELSQKLWHVILPNVKAVNFTAFEEMTPCLLRAPH